MTGAGASLPELLPVFPLPEAVLFPQVTLPLNIFEPRYLAMTDYALAHGRLIGMIQPRPHGAGLFDVGCAGRIVSFKETGDGRYLITLQGVSRFRVEAEAPLHAGGFRLVRPDWASFSGDLAAEDDDGLCRDALIDSLRPYLAKMDMDCDQWQSMREIPCGRLVATLSMICPFTVEEKQMLLEAADVESRMKVLCAFLESALGDGCCAGRH
jgi:Lon protease-like protein